MAKWSFYYVDNGGKRQSFTVTAPDKQTAIDKGLARAKKHAAGDCITWDCKLNTAY